MPIPHSDHSTSTPAASARRGAARGRSLRSGRGRRRAGTGAPGALPHAPSRYSASRCALAVTSPAGGSNHDLPRRRPDAVAGLLSGREVVEAYQQGPCVTGHDLGERVHDDAGASGVQARDRFVGQHQRRVLHQHPRQATRCCSPPEDRSVRASARSSMPRRRIASRAGPGSVHQEASDRAVPPSSEATGAHVLQRAVRGADEVQPLVDGADAERTARSPRREAAARSTPRTSTVPAASGRAPRHRPSRVLLPAPLGPTSATRSPVRYRAWRSARGQRRNGPRPRAARRPSELAAVGAAVPAGRFRSWRLPARWFPARCRGPVAGPRRPTSTDQPQLACDLLDLGVVRGLGG